MQTACVTLPPDNLFRVEEVPRLEKPECISVTFHKNELDWDGSIRSNALGFQDHRQDKLDLKSLGFLTDCESPVASYKITYGLRHRNVFVSFLKGILTVASLTIIPYFDDHPYQVTVERSDGKVLLDKEIIIQKRVWLFYIAKWWELEGKASDTFQTYVPNAIFMKEIGSVLKADIKPTSSLRPH